MPERFARFTMRWSRTGKNSDLLPWSRREARVFLLQCVGIVVTGKLDSEGYVDVVYGGRRFVKFGEVRYSLFGQLSCWR